MKSKRFNTKVKTHQKRYTVIIVCKFWIEKFGKPCKIFCLVRVVEKILGAYLMIIEGKLLLGLQIVSAH